MNWLATEVAEAAAAVRQRWDRTPSIGIILGTGLGQFADELADSLTIPYSAIPHFPLSQALSHAGRAVCGQFAGVDLIALSGRSHLYEGHPLERLEFPVRCLANLGVRTLIVTNASGGLNPRLASGDVLVITSHIDLMGRRAISTAGDSRPRGAGPYDRQLADLALAAARRHQFPAIEGTYIGMSGPNYETRAEYRFLRRIGGDAVGMSTIPEVQVAARLGLRCLALSVVTNVASPDIAVHTTPEAVVAAATRSATRLAHLVRAAIAAERLLGVDR